ncbi:MAG: carboxypeptidase-like regulatory domain-containing protein [Marinilabiliaceae bacterium]|nr:carboxypeptidase-like regulatory domain-containing protein [Marinilabiliaceae bacterium]
MTSTGSHHQKGLHRLLRDMDENPFAGHEMPLDDDAADAERRFDEDARQGLSSLQDEELAFDVHDLRQRLRSRKASRWMPLLLKAAGVLLLLAIPSLLFWMVVRVTRQPQLADNRPPVAIRVDSVAPIVLDPAEVPELHDEELDLSREVVAKSEKPVTMKQIAKNLSPMHDDVIELDVVVDEDLEMDAELQALIEKVRVQQNESFKTFNSQNGGIRRTIPSSPVIQEVRPIIGQVFDEQGLPIPGVAVVIKGSSQGTITNMDGEFVLPPIDDKDSAQVLLSFIGYETKEAVLTNQHDNEVQLSPSLLALDEVVVAGYGSQRKKSLFSSQSLNKAEAEADVFVPAVPPIPMDRYVEQIETNLVYPSVGTGKKVSLWVVLTLSSTGQVTVKEVQKSPDEAYRAEVERVLRELPLWKPATRDGVAVEDEQKIKLTFYPAR